MNKLFKFIQTLMVVFYIIGSIYLLIFNWSVFTIALPLDLGFGTINVPPFLLIMLFSMLTILLIWFNNYTKDLRNELLLVKKEGLLNKAKESQGIPDKKWSEAIALLQKQIDELKGAKSTKLVKA